jgi:hypothetical protein
VGVGGGGGGGGGRGRGRDSGLVVVVVVCVCVKEHKFIHSTESRCSNNKGAKGMQAVCVCVCVEGVACMVVSWTSAGDGRVHRWAGWGAEGGGGGGQRGGGCSGGDVVGAMGDW